MTQRRRATLFALPLAFVLVATSCGGSDDSAVESPDGDSAADSTETADDGSTVTDDTESDDTESDDTESDTTESDTTGDTTASAEGDVSTDAAEAEGEATFGGSITVGLEAEAVGLRPWEDSCAAPCYSMMVSIYDKLFEKTDEGVLEGYLAESIEPNEDFTVWTMQLRPDVTFHNGVALTAQTIADMFPIQQAGTASASQVSASALSGVEATGDLEVTYTLSRPNAAFPAFLERATLGMVFDPAAATADPDGYSTAPIGTGPFAIDRRDLDNETIVVRNDDYWRTDADGEQLPYLDSITFRPIPDEGTRLDAILSGTVNVMQTLRQGTIRDARADGGLNLIEFQGSNVGGGFFNTQKAPFDDVRVRKGLTHLNSQDNVIEALGGTGISLPGSQFFSPDSPWFSQEVADAWPQFDFEAGTALLQEYIDDPARSDGKAAGEKIDVTLSCPPDPTLIAAMQVLEQVWSSSELVNVNLTSFDQQTHINNAIADDSGAHCWRFSDDNDPSLTMNSAVAPPTAEIAAAEGLDGQESIANWANYWDRANYDAAVAAVQTDDFDERFAQYESIMLDYTENVPVWYSGYTATLIATAPDVKGVNGWHLPSGALGAGQQGGEGRWVETFISE